MIGSRNITGAIVYFLISRAWLEDFNVLKQSTVRSTHCQSSTSGSDVRQRASDIVKLRSNNSSSPERSLLGHRSPTASAMTSADTFRSRSGIDVERGDPLLQLSRHMVMQNS